MDEITAVCSMCRCRIAPGGGVLAVDLYELPKGRASWRAVHYKCHPNLDVLTYGIDLDRLGSAERFREWDEHLAGKSWLKRTDWARVSERAQSTGRVDTGLWFPPAPIESTAP